MSKCNKLEMTFLNNWIWNIFHHLYKLHKETQIATVSVRLSSSDWLKNTHRYTNTADLHGHTCYHGDGHVMQKGKPCWFTEFPMFLSFLFISPSPLSCFPALKLLLYMNLNENISLCSGFHSIDFLCRATRVLDKMWCIIDYRFPS